MLRICQALLERRLLIEADAGMHSFSSQAVGGILYADQLVIRALERFLLAFTHLKGPH